MGTRFCRTRRKQDHLIAVSVAERPHKQIALSETEFEEAAAELAPERSSADAHALFLENLAKGSAEYTTS